MFKQSVITLLILPATAAALVFCAIAVMIGIDAEAASPASVTKIVDLTKTPIRGLPPSLTVTLYRDSASGEKRPLVVLIPKFGAQMSDAPYAQQAEYFVKLGYVVAIPHLTGLYNDGVEAPVYDARMDADLVADTARFAVELLAMVADISAAQGPSTANHAIVGEGLGSIIAARYAALGVPGLKGVILISAGFGPKRSSMSSFDDMRASERAFRQLGAKVSVPSLWLYAKGNKRVSESTANDLFTAYKSGNSGARLVILPEIGMDGDALFSKAEPETTWAGPVSAFLRSIEFH